MKKALSMAAFTLAMLVSVNSFASTTYSLEKEKTTKKAKSSKEKEEKSCVKTKSSCCSKTAKAA